MKVEKKLPTEYIANIVRPYGNEWSAWDARNIVKKRIERSIAARKKNINKDVINEIYFDVTVIKKYVKYNPVYFTRVYCGRSTRNTKKMISSKANESINLKTVVTAILEAAEKDLLYSKAQKQEWDNYAQNEKLIERLEKKFDIDFFSPIKLSATDEKNKIEITFKKTGDENFIVELIGKLKQI